LTDLANERRTNAQAFGIWAWQEKENSFSFLQTGTDDKSGFATFV